MTAIQKKIILAGIKIKLNRGEDLGEVLETYVNLTAEDKEEIRNELA